MRIRLPFSQRSPVLIICLRRPAFLSGLLAALLMSALTAAAQTANAQSPAEGIQKRWSEWGVWGDISFDSATLIGTTPNARFGNVGLRYGRVLAASKTVAFEWTIDAIPLSIFSGDRFTVTPTATGPLITHDRKSVYGWGAAPIGLKFNFRRNRSVQPFGQVTGGFLYFSDQVPVAGSSQYNFTFDLSGGMQIVNSKRRAFTVGYKFQHISNGNTGTLNPGVDVQMVFVGFSVFR
ncbi:MAG TPA: acyloxyacyl hydrolase [Pyrinomonadaceae bacterium]|nr:acyloxyacyl hydrolase [Pyrinomonadaceae bacterium]